MVWMGAVSQQPKETQMRFGAIWVVILAAVLTVGNAWAIAPGKTIEFTGSKEGKVVFDGKTHADKGLKCPDCHTKIAPMKKTAAPTHADMDAGKMCGACHDGKKAFATKDKANCNKCHKK
jgi:c(7)-type cytochrome triheme protein